MTHREELVVLITNGTAPPDIYSHFQTFMGRASILDLLKSSGVFIPLPPTGKDEITDERRKFLQDLSLADD